MGKHVAPKKKSARGRKATYDTVDDYLARVPEESRLALTRLRRIVKAAAPQATEGISYGMPVFRHHGPLVYFAAFENHCSFFPASRAVIRTYRLELKGYPTSAGTIRFTTQRPLPAALVRKMVKARVAENEKHRKR